MTEAAKVDPFDVQCLLACATNEGTLYPRWCRMARALDTHDGAWTDQMRLYARRLRRERRYDGSLGAPTIIAAAMAVRDYYLVHIKENAE